MLIIYTTCYMAAFIFLIMTCYQSFFGKFHVIAKVICSAGFIGAAVLGKMQSSNDALFWRLLPGFIFCFLGDFFLAKKERKESKQDFLLGLGSFLAGHILFLRGLSFLQPWSAETVLVPFVGVIVAFFLMKRKNMEAGEFKIPIMVYSYFVTALFVKCAQIALKGPGSLFFILLFLGGLFFLISDIIILFLYFYKKKYGIMKFLNLFTYYTATYILGIAILFY
ncbi:MAG: lysoplasmalogenase family protein [Acetivibrio sp.]